LVITLTVHLPSPDDLPEGPRRDLLESVHRLYQAAGMPGVRRISDEIRRRDEFSDTVSAETVSNILNGTSIPRWSKLQPVAQVLADGATGSFDRDRAIERVHHLWLATQDIAPPPAGGVFRNDDQPVEAAIQSQFFYPPGLVVTSEEARIRYSGGRYEYTVERALFNEGTEAVEKFDVKLSVDRYPHDVGRSAEHHRNYPLTWDELCFEASCDGEPMDWLPLVEDDRVKEVRLRFGNDEIDFPLLPGRKCKVLHTSTFTDQQWGRWLQRNIRLSTTSLVMRVELPADSQPVVWSLTMDPEGVPSFRSRRKGIRKHGNLYFMWQPRDVRTGWMYRMEWSFGAPFT
jgi:hypothetical protein